MALNKAAELCHSGLPGALYHSILPFICDDLRKRFCPQSSVKLLRNCAMTKKRWLVQSDLQDKLQTL